MTPLLALALFLLAVSVGVLANEVRTIRALDRLWAQQRARLLALNTKRPISGLLAHKYAIERMLFFGEPDQFEYAPGAQWIVTDPASVQVLDARLAS